MTRDPSDGSVKPPTKSAQVVQCSLPSGESEPAVTPACAGADTNLFAEIRAALLAGKVRPEKVFEQWAYQRAWNDAIDFSLRQISNIEKRTDPESVARRNGEQGE